MIKFFIVFIFLTLTTCTSYRYIMENQINDYYNQKQIDSICILENIPDMYDNSWRNVYYLDDETGNIIDQYVYIKDQDTIQYVYTITDLDSIFIFKKRVTKKIK